MMTLETDLRKSRCPDLYEFWSQKKKNEDVVITKAGEHGPKSSPRLMER